MLTRRQAQLLQEQQQQHAQQQVVKQEPEPEPASAVAAALITVKQEPTDPDALRDASDATHLPRRTAASRLLSSLRTSSTGASSVATPVVKAEPTVDRDSSAVVPSSSLSSSPRSTIALAQPAPFTRDASHLPHHRHLKLRSESSTNTSDPSVVAQPVQTGPSPAPPLSTSSTASRQRLSFRPVHADDAVFTDSAVTHKQEDGDEAVTSRRMGRPPKQAPGSTPVPSPASRRLQLSLRASTQQRMRHGLWSSTMAEEAQAWYARARGYSSDVLELDLDDDDDDDVDGENDDAEEAGGEAGGSSRGGGQPKRAALFFPAQKLPPLPPAHGTTPAMRAPVATRAWAAVVADLTLTSQDSAATLRQRVNNKRRALVALQTRLADAIHRQYYLHVHEKRMQQLLSCTSAETDATALTSSSRRLRQTIPREEGEEEAAYLSTLDRSQSEREAAMLDTITALDKQLQAQFASVYHLTVDPEETARTTTTATTTAVASSEQSAVMSAEAAAGKKAEAARAQAEADTAVWWQRLRLAALSEAVEEATQLVPAFRDVLMPYQKEGVRWMLQLNAMEQLNGILADDMGLGKTAQTVMYLTSYKLLVENVVQRRLERLLRAAYEEAPLAYSMKVQLDEDDYREDQHRDTAPSEEGEEALTDAEKDERAQQRARLQRLVLETRLAKELKRWVWQLSEADVSTGDEKGSHRSSLASTYAALADVAYPETNSAAVQYMRQLLSLPACSPQLNALLEVGENTTDEDAEEIAEDGRPLLRDEPTSPDATNSAVRLHEHLGRRCMRPIIILAPLSTLPHWAAEFAHFGADHLFALYPLNGSREERVQVAKQFLRHVRGEPLVEAPRNHKRRRPPSAEEQRRLDVLRRAGAGERARRRRVRADMEDADPFHHPYFGRTPVLLLAHDFLARQHASSYQRQLPHVTFHVVVIDEAQRIKNKAAELFRRVCRLRTTSRVILTGTPLQNNIKELFALLQFIAPESFHTRRQADLLDQLDAALGHASRSSASEDAHLHMLLCRRVHRLLTPFILRRDKSVLKAVLPTKKDFLVVCPLLPRQVEELAEVDAKVQTGNFSGHPHVHIRKILLHPYTRLPYFYIDDEITATSGKVLVLDFMMSFLRATGHKFLVFCSWTLVLDVVESLCQYRALPYVRLDGNTTAEQRESNIQRFNNTAPAAGDEEPADSPKDEDVKKEEEEEEALPPPPPMPPKKSHKKKVVPPPDGADDTADASPAFSTPQQQRKPAGPGEEPCCFLISKVAGGVGLNLQSADTVFLLDVDYNPQRDLQALSRVYRVGQKREVRIFRLIVDHPVEQNVLEIHHAKENLDQAVVQAGKFDLHSSSDDRQAELNKLFGVAYTPSGAEGLVPTDAQEVASPVSPSAPLGLHLPNAARRPPHVVEETTDQEGKPVADAEAHDQDKGQHGTGSLPPRCPRRRSRPELVVPPATPAEHLVEMGETFREILPRSQAEGEVLEEMLRDLTRRRSARHTDHVQI